MKQPEISIKLCAVFVLYFKTSRCYYLEFVLYFMYPVRITIKFHNTAVLHSGNPLPNNKSPPFVACIVTPIDDFKASPTPYCSCLSKSHNHGNYGKVPYIVLSCHQPHKAILKALLTSYQTELAPPPLPRTSTKGFVQVQLLQESDLQLANLKSIIIETSIYRSPFKILQIKTGVAQH